MLFKLLIYKDKLNYFLGGMQSFGGAAANFTLRLHKQGCSFFRRQGLTSLGSSKK